MPIKKTGRIITTANLIVIILASIIFGWLSHQWLSDWMGYSVEFGELIANGFGYIFEFMKDPNTPKNMGIWTTAIVGISSGIYQVLSTWKKRKIN